MDLPVMPPVPPMLAKPVRSIPPDASYEPKWDGFRSICFRDGDQVELGSRNKRSMTRYFPELVAAVRTELPERCVLDGEIVVATDHGLDFEALQQRIQPAARSSCRRVGWVWALDPCHAGDHRSGDRAALVRGIRGRQPRRHHRQATIPHL